MDKIEHIMERFDKNDFKDISDWKSKFYNDDLVIYHNDSYISLKEILSLKTVKKPNLHKF